MDSPRNADSAVARQATAERNQEDIYNDSPGGPDYKSPTKPSVLEPRVITQDTVMNRMLDSDFKVSVMKPIVY